MPPTTTLAGQWKAVQDFLLAEFAPHHTDIDIDWSGWSGEIYKPTSGQSFIRPTILDGVGEQIGIGGTVREHRFYGVLMIQVAFPAGSGATAGLGICDALSDLFRARTIVGAGTFKTPRGMRPFRDGDFQMFGISVDFYRDAQDTPLGAWTP